MAVVVYPNTALAMSVLRSRPRSSPPGSANAGESSKMEFCAGREEKVCDVCGSGGGWEGGLVFVEGEVKDHVGECAP
jgi:hypothetical protein